MVFDFSLFRLRKGSPVFDFSLLRLRKGDRGTLEIASAVNLREPNLAPVEHSWFVNGYPVLITSV